MSAFYEMGDKLYATARAYVVNEPDDLPREMASEFEQVKSNKSFLWVAGRYVQGENMNKNGHFWTMDDLRAGEASIAHTPVNALHQWDQPIGTLVQTKFIERETASQSFPEIQALGVVWAMNFPEMAELIKKAHAEKNLFWSMECISESKQCLTCERTYDYKATAAEVCEHLATNKIAPRRFINPTFVGGALVFPPDKPAWPDANVTDVAKTLTSQYASRETDKVAQWESLMNTVVHIYGS